MGTDYARQLQIGTIAFREKNGNYPTSLAELVSFDLGYIPAMAGPWAFYESTESRDSLIYFIQTLEATGGLYIFAASAPVRKEFSSNRMFYRIVVPVDKEATDIHSLMLPEAGFQAVLSAALHKSVDEK